jgi:sigma-54 dependent transcriptional regulator, acetoin dehydrogenase operon transcriptional activator AcoR
MSIQTETLNVGGERVSAAAASVGLVTLYAPDPAALPSAVELPDHPLAFGREPPPGGLVLPFASVSRLHARIAVRGAEIVVDDLDSRNGTFVNGGRVKRAFVEDGDEIRIGEVVFKLVAGDVGPFASWPPAGTVPPAPFDVLRGGAAMERVRHEIARTATTDLSVLVLGETGTGKELVAHALHRASGRPGRLATVNCAAIPATLLESELFGYKRGAFTGADRDRIGIVKSADGGTLFLDEIGDMPLDAQAKLLRMIETRTVTPLGSHVAEPVDVRIVSATHRPLGRFVREERFRADLFARISGHTIELVPLRERKEDIYQLVQLFLGRASADRANAKGADAPLRVTAPFMIGLLEHDWPLNVRELETAIRRAVALADGVLEEAHLPPAALEARDEARDEPRAGSAGAASTSATRASAPSAEDLRALLTRHGGNVAAVARELGKDRVQIHRWMRRHAISPDEFRS